jgi:hypothetical protein
MRQRSGEPWKGGIPMECADLFWRQFYKPLHRHEERRQEARLRAGEGRTTRLRAVPRGRG